MLPDPGTVRSELTIQKVSREGLYEQVVEQLQDLIFEKHLRSGNRLPGERELCQQFGVSRTVIREATKVLAQRGMLAIKPGRGTFVTLPTEHDVARSIALFARAHDVTFADLGAVRHALEPAIAELAAGHASEKQIQSLQAAIDAMDANLADPDAYIAADHDFHSILAEATENQLLMALTGVTVNLAQSARRLMFAMPDAPIRGQYYHRKILACVAAGDGAGARAMMLDHLRQVDQDVSAAAAVSNQKMV